MGQSAVYMGKGTTLGKRDTTLSHHYTFSVNYCDDRLLYNLTFYSNKTNKKMHNVFMIRWSAFHAPIHSAAFAMDKQFCWREMDEGIKNIWTTREKVTGRDTFFLKKIDTPPPKKCPVRRTQGWGVLLSC
jgi:hypothetical protein